MQQERELIKLASWTNALVIALRGRGVEAQTASLAAAAGVAAFRVAFARWVSSGESPTLVALICASFQGMRALAAA